MDTETGLAVKLAKLETILSDYVSVVVAFSGGVDSTLLLRVASGLPGLECMALTTASSTNTPEEVTAAVALARSFNVSHRVVTVDELATPGYADNPAHRCYLCKQTLYPLCRRVADEKGYREVADGMNMDDMGDYRPGLVAAEQWGVRHPLVEAGLGKEELRTLSRDYALPTASRPASPCLSSRFPYGTRITHERLGQVARAEAALKQMGFVELRVRHLGHGARVEVAATELDRLSRMADHVSLAVTNAGFDSVLLSESPLRSGSLNDVLAPQERRAGLVFE